jgi:hypothetical protein
MTRRLLRTPKREAGAFAIAAVLILLVVVAAALRFLLAVAESNSSATLSQQQGVKALLAADSGVEVMLATLRKNGPGACSIASIPPGTLDGANYSLVSASTLTNIAVAPSCNTLLVSRGCRGQVQASIGNSSRIVNVDIAYCSPTSAGVTGFGGHTTNIAQTITPYQANAVIVSNLAFRRKSDSGGPNTSATSCQQTGAYSGSCTQGWSVQSSSGLPAIGGRGVIATTTAVGDYRVIQNLGADRNYVVTGAIFEGTGVTYLGAYADDQSAQNKGTVGTSNTVAGQVTDGRTMGSSATGTVGWCKGADTLVFGFSAKAQSPNDTLTSVSFGNGQLPMMLLERFTSITHDLYSEVWYLNRPLASGGIDGLFTTGIPTNFNFTVSGSTTDEWAAGFACLKNVDPSTPRGLVSFMQPYHWWEPF